MIKPINLIKSLMVYGVPSEGDFKEPIVRAKENCFKFLFQKLVR